MKLNTLKRRPRLLIGVLAILSVGALLQVTNTNPAVSQTLLVNAYTVPDDPGTDPSNPVWNKVNAVNVPLTAQSLAYVAGGSVQTVRVQAVHFGSKVYIRVNWKDATDDSSTTRVEDFADAVALEFPAAGGTTVPAICMGQAGAAVNIWHWRADSNSGLIDPNLVYDTSLVDGYPSTEKLFYTAREANNPFANPELGPVQTLYAESFGTLAALSIQDVAGAGERDGEGWSVVFSRDLESTNPGHVAFAANTQIDMALAVWDGSNDERNGRKSTSQFVTLGIADAPAFKEDSNSGLYFAMAAGALLGVTAIGIALGAYGYSQAKNR